MLLSRLRITSLPLIFVVLLGIVLLCQISVGFPSETQSLSEYSDQTINLFFSREMHEAEAYYQRLIIIPFNNWNTLILKMLTQNFGESLDSVVISVRSNDEIIEKTFNTYEQSGFRNSIAHQFEQVQELIIPLNFTKRDQVPLSITVMLDSLISWRKPDFNFTIISSTLHCVSFIQPGEKIQNLPVFSSTHTYVVQSSQISLFSKKILSKYIIPISIPEGMVLYSILNVTMSGATFDFLSLGSGANEANGGNIAQINTTITSDMISEQFWEIQLYTLPSLPSNDDFVPITISVDAQGIIKPLDIDKTETFLSTHPIPGLLMIPLLIFVLFGIPYYYVYQEELTEKNEQILEYDKGRI